MARGSYLRLLMVSHEFPPYIFGGVGTFCYNLSKALAEAGHQVTVVAGCPSKAIKAKLVKTRVVDGNLEILQVPRIDFPPSHFWYQMMNLGLVRELLPEFDIVHGQDPAVFPMIYYSKKKGIKTPWVVTIQTGPVSQLYYTMRSVSSHEGSLRDLFTYVVGFPLWDVSLRAHARLADAIVGVSENVSKEILDCYGVEPRRLFTVYNAVDIDNLERIAEAESSPSSNTGKIRLFFGGRLYWCKGVIPLLKSIHYLAKEIGFQGFQLDMFGTGPLERKVREFIENHDLARNVKLHGFVQRRELMASMAASDVVCFPSIYEACPLGMMEAMALGKPVAVFDRRFSRELLRSYPELPAATSVEDYAKNLHALCASEDLRKTIGTRLRRLACERFDIKTVAEDYVKIYREIL